MQHAAYLTLLIRLILRVFPISHVAATQSMILYRDVLYQTTFCAKIRIKTQLVSSYVLVADQPDLVNRKDALNCRYLCEISSLIEGCQKFYLN
jgi:hypothetical protein